MKPKNFPARKLARKIAAQQRKEGYSVSSLDILECPNDHEISLFQKARAIRTKKNMGR